MPLQCEKVVTEEPTAKKVRTGTFISGKETVFFEGVDGKKNEYCPYTETSKNYDETRAPLGLNIALGSMSLNDKPLNEQHLLDIGCGTGTFLDAVKDKVATVSGLEYNDGMIGQARARLGNSTKIQKLVQGSADMLPFQDESFDVCTINQVIHHFPTDNNYVFCLKTFQEAYRVLKPGGTFVVNTSTPEQQRDAFWWLSLFPRASDAICSRFPPLEVLKSHMKAANFEFTADSVTTPLHRPLMAENKYLLHGVKAGFMPEYRCGDSSWAMAENFGELDEGLKTLQKMIDEGTAEEWLAGRESLRKSMGQATFVTVRKSLNA
jgi:ubiquinone/menaquinone biosynthesis C-methylase UbiE